MNFKNIYERKDGTWARNSNNITIYKSVEILLPNLFLAQDINGEHWFFIDPETGEQQQPIMSKKPEVKDASAGKILVYPLLYHSQINK